MRGCPDTIPTQGVLAFPHTLKEKGVICMAVAAKYKIGQTSIVIHDDYCKNQTEEEVNEILNNISRIVSRHLREEMYQKELERQKAV